MKKVLLAVPQLTGGGAERVVSVWSNELSENGYDVSVIALSKLDNEYSFGSKVKVNYIKEDINDYLALGYFKRLKKLRKFLKREKPDYIISFLPTMQVWIMLASIGLKCKRIETIRNNPWQISFSDKLQRALWLMCYHRSHKIILQSTGQKPFFSKKDQKKCVLIPNPISKLYIENYKENISDKPNLFIAAGRIAPQKNYKMMIAGFARACETRPDLKLEIFGTGKADYIEEIENFIKEKNMQNNVFLMGRSPDLEKEYKKNDVFLMTSDFEGLPNALMEAMASRLICISTDCKTGPGDLINNAENGYLIPVGSEDSLYETIEKVLNSTKAEREKMANSAREKILSYCSEQNSLKKLCEILK